MVISQAGGACLQGNAHRLGGTTLEPLDVLQLARVAQEQHKDDVALASAVAWLCKTLGDARVRGCDAAARARARAVPPFSVCLCRCADVGRRG